jgi:hypothetical protein
MEVRLHNAARVTRAVLGTLHVSMRPASNHLDFRAIASKQKPAGQLRRENELFAEFARSARVDLAASRRLG